MVKYRTETYTKHHAWTSYNKLSLEAAKAIEDSCYDDIPTEIEVEIEGTHQLVIFYDTWGDFTPVNEAYENPGKIWSHSKKTDWYTHIVTGVKVKKEVVKSTNYDQSNGNGTCTITLTVKIPIPSERGKNPNSHNNRAIPGLISRDVRLTEDQWQTVESWGDGKGYSQGVRNLLGRFETV